MGGRPITSVREDTLRCSGCRQWLPDEAFSLERRKLSRRFRGSECTDCGKARLRSFRQQVNLPINVYVVTRTPDQQGRSVPIFASWTTKVRER